MDYLDFLQKKKNVYISAGICIEKDEFNTHLFDFQCDIVGKALKKGRYAIFADCGLGKTLMQLQWSNVVAQRSFKPVIILAPLAVAGQTIKEAEKFGLKCERYVLGKEMEDNGVYISNYEQIEHIEAGNFVGIVLDESSILKNFTGEYKKKIIEKFRNTPYKLACTATPAPNDLNEIGNHSEFLDIMDANDMRMRWFIRDEGMNNYRLKGHAELDFYGWISSWASVLRKPCDIGFDNGTGYDLPNLNLLEYEISTESRENGLLFNEGAVNATNFNRELKLTQKERLDKVVEIVNAYPDDSFIIWIRHNEEGTELKNRIQGAMEVKGADSNEYKEKTLLGFANNEFRILITKQKIAQFGMNFQNCSNQIFASLDFSFEGLYQAIRRSYRFGQKKEVNIHLITTDTMNNVRKIIDKKMNQFNKMMDEITKNVNEQSYSLKMDYDKRELANEHYHIMNGDSAELIKEIPSNSMDMSVFSPPFSTLFTYSDSIRDMGNCANDEEFFEQQDFLLKELYRIMKNGRLVCVHTKDLARYKNSSGYSGMYDFTGDYHRAMEKAGFRYHSKITIWIDPVLEMQRTKTQRLLYKQVTSDSSYSGIGMPEYITIFRKWEGDERDWTPINNKSKENFDLNRWQKWASPIWAIEDLDNEMEMVIPLLSNDALDNLPKEVLKKYGSSSWFDISRTNVLNNFRDARGLKDEKHICPLQLDIIERCIALWSNKGETIFTPFIGIGSELYQAIKMGRKGVGIELKEEYYDTAIRNLNNVISQKNQLSLF